MYKVRKEARETNMLPPVFYGERGLGGRRIHTHPYSHLNKHRALMNGGKKQEGSRWPGDGDLFVIM